MAIGIPALAVLFALTAILYASVGFGGGSTYIALLALADLDYRFLPAVALACNIIVVTGGTLRFQARGLVPWRRVLPILLLSVPFAWLGGRIPIAENSFLLLLGTALLIAGILLAIEPLVQRSVEVEGNSSISASNWFAPVAGSAIGFLSGMVGIGGGIFLAPLLFLTRWAESRKIAATASVFILVNSIAGLAGQLMKSGNLYAGGGMLSYWPLFVAVLLGGQVGSHLASRALPEIWIRRLTALLIIYVALRILWQQVG